ncbi:MAG: carboxypeptidase regulatory-like domain-containing protein [Terriglobia bacterium]
MKPAILRHAFWLVFACIFLLPGGARAQNLNASIGGLVLDPSGAAVPNARLTFTNIATHSSRTTATNSAGHYLLPSPEVGTYDVSVEARGFKAWHQSSLIVNVGENITLNMKLQVGSLTQSVNVTATPARVNTSNAEIGGVIGQSQIQSIAVNGRDYISLAALVPGARSRLPDQPYTGGGGTGGGSNIAFNGLRLGANNWMVDGAENEDTGSNSAPETYPALDAIEEFRVSTSNYSAAYPTAAGGIVNIAIKSGTDQFHGSAYEFFRNDTLDANNFFSNRAGQTVPPLKQNDFGFTIGGPIRKDKTFFFYSQEWRRFREGLTQLNHFPSPLELAGNFSQSPMVGNAKSLKTPPGVPAGCVSGLQINPSCFNANAVALLKSGIFPAANDVVPGVFDNYVASPVEPINFAQELLRIDHHFSDRFQIFGHYIHEQFFRELPDAEFGADNFPTIHSARQMPDYNLQLGLTKTFSPTLIDQANFNLSYDGIQILPTGIYQRPTGLSVPELFPVNPDNRIPSLFFSQAYGTYDVTDLPWHNFERIYDWQDTVTKVAGPHTLEFGGLYIFSQKDQITGGRSQGDFSFNGAFTGNSLADFLLGYPNNYTELSTQTVPKYRYNQVEAFAQDDWKVKPSLTLNLGVRWFLIPHAYTKGNLLSNFLPGQWSASEAPTLNSGGNISCTPGASTCNTRDGLFVAGTNGVPPGLSKTVYDDFGPRVGFAWDLSGHGTTVLRGGLGMGYYRVQGNDTYNVTNNPPFATNETLDYTSANKAPPLNNPAEGSAAPLAPPSLLVINPYYPPPLIEQYSLGIERQISPSSTLSVAYVGSHGEHLPGSRDLNQPLPVPGFNFNPTLNQTPAPPTNLYRPYTGWGAITEEEMTDLSDYNSLQVNFERHMSKGVQVGAAYTYSKAMDDGSGYSDAPQNAYDRRADWAPSAFNSTHVLQLNYDWDLPFLKRRGGALGTVLGGWEFAGITTVETGLPLNIGLTGAGHGLATRPDAIAAINPIHEVDEWFSTSSFAAAPPGFFGNSARDSVTGPAMTVFNWSLYKHFYIHERFDSELRFEAYNVFNQVNFNGVSTSLGAGNFGVVTSAHDPRIIQLGLMLHF